MKNILNAPFVEEMRKTTANMYRLGWDERNGGNISYMLDEEEVAQYLDLNGKIKGNIDVGGKAEFKTDAIVLGNITASTITVLDGATIQGYVNTTFLQESSSSIFPDAIAVTE